MESNLTRRRRSWRAHTEHYVFIMIFTFINYPPRGRRPNINQQKYVTITTV